MKNLQPFGMASGSRQPNGRKTTWKHVTAARQGGQGPTGGSLVSAFKRQIHTMTNVFTTKHARTQVYLGIIFMSFQQLSGIDGVLYVSPSRCCFLRGSPLIICSTLSIAVPASRHRLSSVNVPRIWNFSNSHHGRHHTSFPPDR